MSGTPPLPYLAEPVRWSRKLMRRYTAPRLRGIAQVLLPLPLARAASPGGSRRSTEAMSCVTKTTVRSPSRISREDVAAFLLERGVANRKDLVDQQDLSPGD